MLPTATGKETKRRFIMWSALPYDILSKVFSLLSPRDAYHAAQTCSNWIFAFENDEELWHLYCRTMLKCGHQITCPENSTWRAVYMQCHLDTPAIKYYTNYEHRDEVLHVTFAPNGKLFSSCSKDGCCRIFDACLPTMRLLSTLVLNAKPYVWAYPHFSQFNKDSNLLLVSGVLFGAHTFKGEICVFQLTKLPPSLLSRVRNEPFDVFGCWLGYFVLSGELSTRANHENITTICISKPLQDVVDSYDAVFRRAFRFLCRHGSQLRLLLLASPSVSARADKLLIACGSDKTYLANQVYIKILRYGEIPYPGKVKMMSLAEAVKRKNELDVLHERIRELREQLAAFGAGDAAQPAANQPAAEPEAARPAKPEEELLDAEDFDHPDVIFDLHGQIVGMSLSVDQTRLYVNYRAWPPVVDEYPLYEAVPVADEIEMRVIDLLKLAWIPDEVYRGHVGHTPAEHCFFIYPTSTLDNAVIASGAENNFAYVWRRPYSMPLEMLPHGACVNCIATSSRDSNMLVTASDDKKMCVWITRRAARRMGYKYSGHRILGQDKECQADELMFPEVWGPESTTLKSAAKAGVMQRSKYSFQRRSSL